MSGHNEADSVERRDPRGCSILLVPGPWNLCVVPNVQVDGEDLPGVFCRAYAETYLQP